MIVIKPLIGLIMLLLPHASHALPRVDPGADEACFVQQTNATRAAKGLSVLPVSGPLAGQARGHTQAMASSNSLYHSSGDQYPGGWLGLGENVGVGPTCDDIEQAFLASPHHYENIVDPKWTSIGVGVVPSSDGNGIWVTVGFEQWQATTTPPAATPPAPAPARTTAPPPATTATPRAPARTAPAPARTTAVPAPSRTTAPATPKASQTALPSPSASASPSASPSLPPAVLPLGEPPGTPSGSVTPSGLATPRTTNVPQVLAAAKASRGVLGLGVAMALCLAVGGLWGIRDRRRR
jgi:hypothetical protein